MAKLIYSALASLDGYVADAGGGFDWAAPDAEVHAFVNELERPIGTYLYGRRMYEVMTYWENAPAVPDRPGVERDYARIWRAADKVVYSTTLTRVRTRRTTLEPRFDPEAIRRLKESTDRDLSVGGPALAGHALRAGLVDELHVFLVPELVGGGTSLWPDGVRASVDLVDEHRFGGGVVYLRYRVRQG